jgi:hypothetical protein
MVAEELKYTPLPDPRYPSRYQRFMVGYPYDDTKGYFRLDNPGEIPDNNSEELTK